ncbi:hypothetical protein [Geminocystis sp.]
MTDADLSYAELEGIITDENTKMQIPEKPSRACHQLELKTR